MVLATTLNYHPIAIPDFSLALMRVVICVNDVGQQLQVQWTQTI
jgi:hypothetical protein